MSSLAISRSIICSTGRQGKAGQDREGKQAKRKEKWYMFKVWV